MLLLPLPFLGTGVRLPVLPGVADFEGVIVLLWPLPLGTGVVTVVNRVLALAGDTGGIWESATAFALAAGTSARRTLLFFDLRGCVGCRPWVRR